VFAHALAAVLLFQALAPSPIPLAPGSFWEYQESYSEQRGDVAATEDATTRFLLTRGRNGLFLVQRGGADPVSGPVELGSSWLRLLPWTGEDALPLPLEIGRAGPGSGDDHPGWKVEAEEEVTVPAGVFRTLRCAIRTSSHVSLLWIAPGVGVVKETHGAPRRRPEIERVLLRFKLAG
jgi:hypothetical protein